MARPMPKHRIEAAASAERCVRALMRRRKKHYPIREPYTTEQRAELEAMRREHGRPPV